MNGEFYAVTNCVETFAEFRDRGEAIVYAKQKARKLKGTFTVYVLRTIPQRAGTFASFRSDARGYLKRAPT